MNTTMNDGGNQTRNASAPRGSRAALYTAIGAACLAAAGLVTALVLGLGGSSAAHAAPEHQGTHSDTPTVVINGGGSTPTPTPAASPSPTIRLLQQQLAQLHYYDGPINGIDSVQVHQSIEYLQRDAHLPQTGALTPATQSALSRMLLQGNNQMAG